LQKLHFRAFTVNPAEVSLFSSVKVVHMVKNAKKM